jgi:EmrB/QacA subfamily drug resistance transporter
LLRRDEAVSDIREPALAAAPAGPAGPSAAAGDPRRWRALAVLALVQFILILDVGVVNVALPNIQRDLHFSSAGLAWVVNGYALMAGGLLLLGGRLSDLLGRRRMFMTGVVVFAAASLASGAAANSAMLVTSRFAQGVGEALAAPAALGLIAVLFPDPAERTKAIGVWGGVAALGGTFGTVVSGVITEFASWPWIFYINLPVAAFALAAVPRLVDGERGGLAAGGRPDLAGAVTATGGMVALVYGLLQAATKPWGSVSVVLPIVGGLAALAAFVAVERRVANPLVPLRFFTNRTRVTANLVTLFFAAGFFTMFFLLTLYMQDVLGWSALETGLAYLPFGITIGAAIGLSTALMPRVGVKPVMAAGFTLAGVGLLLLSAITPDGGYTTGLLPGLLVMALGAGLAFPGFSNAALHQVSGQDAGLASGVQSAVQQVGGAFGLALLTTVALRHIRHAVTHGTTPAVAATDGYALALFVGGILLLIGAALVMILLERAVSAAPAAAPAKSSPVTPETVSVPAVSVS